MKAFLISLILLLPAYSYANKTIECVRYTILDNKKQDEQAFRFTLSPENATLRYTKVSGGDWFLPSNSVLYPIWVSKDSLRVVAYWQAKDYGVNKERWSPVYLLDIDFGVPDFRDESFGGFADFSETIYSPWKHECRRLD